LVVPVLRLLFNVPPALAAGNALLFVFANTLAASITFWRDRAIDVRRAVTIAAAAIPTSILGAHVVALFTPRGFDLLYGAFLVALATLVLLRRNVKSEPRTVPPRRRLFLEIVVGIAVGFVSSLFGVGGGIVIVPILLVYFGLPAHTVAATSAFIVMLSSPVGIVAHGVLHHLDPYIAPPLLVGGLIGGSLGARWARGLSTRALSVGFAVLLLLAALALILKRGG